MPVPLLAGLAGLFLKAVTAAPAVFEAAKTITEAVTGEALPETARREPAALAAHVEALPDEARAQIILATLEHERALQAMDTTRFEKLAPVENSAEWLRETARPEIARRAMTVLETFPRIFKWMVWAAIVDYGARWGIGLAELATGQTYALLLDRSLMGAIADVAPAAEIFWGPLVTAIAACIAVILKYMGCRERDKAIEAEMQFGRPINATAATVAAAGGGLADIIRAVRGAK
ncbi:MAG: hypothetical protein AB7N54_20145 [Alphaproteobacteria bacterium]